MRAALYLLLAACTHSIDEFDRIDGVQTARDLDILYVFDTSADRASYDLMASQLDVLQQNLTSTDGQLPNLHVGVVTTDLGTRGTLDSAPGPAIGNCAGDGDAAHLVTFGADLDKPYLEDLRGPNGSRIRNFASEEDGDLAAELSLLTNPGTVRAGCEIPQPLEAMKRALDPAINPGFVRDGAKLEIIFLTNDDDCSLARSALWDPALPLGPQMIRCAQQGVVCDDDVGAEGVHTNCRPREDSSFVNGVAGYQQFLDGLKPHRTDISVSAVAGPRTPFRTANLGTLTVAPSCQGPGGFARPAVRLGAMVDAFGGSLIDSCQQADVYQQLTAPIVASQKSCFPSLTMADGDDCRVIEHVLDTETELPPCVDGAAAACWYTFADAGACPLGENRGIAIDRKQSTAPIGSRIEATCFVKD